MNFIKPALVCVLTILAFTKVTGGYCDDDSKLMTQREMHKVLFEEFVKGKKCVYSPDKTKLLEVSIFDRSIDNAEARSLRLPENTENVTGFFDQLVIRGKNCEKVTVSLSVDGKSSKPLKIAASTQKEKVFRLVRFSLAEIKKNKSTENRSSPFLILTVEGPEEFTIEQISLRTLRDLHADYAIHKEQLLKLKSGMIGKLMEELFRSTNKDLSELSASLSQPSEAFDRIVYTRTMASFGNGSHPLRGVANDPRVAKLYEGLLRMHAVDSAKVASELFDGAIQEFKTTWDSAEIIPNSAIYSCNAHLFLCTEFCSAEEALAKMDAWEAWHAERSSKPGQFQFKYLAGLEQTFSLNLQVNLIGRKKGLSIDELNAWVSLKLGPSLLGPPSTDPSFGDGGSKPPRLGLLNMMTSDSQGTTLLTRIPDIKFQSDLDNPVRKEALQKILRDELLDITP